MVRTLAGLVILGTQATPARADEDIPRLVTLDRADRASWLGLDLGYVRDLDGEGTPDYGSATRIELYGQRVARSGLGGYFSTSLTVSHDPGFKLDARYGEQASLGNSEIGVVYAPHARGSVLRAGFVIPTGSTGNGFDEDDATRQTGSVARIVDALVGTEASGYVRVAISGRWRRGRWFARVDVGADHDVREGLPEGTSVRFNGAVGVVLGVRALSLESANTFGADLAWGYGGALAFRHRGRTAETFVAVGGGRAADRYAEAAGFLTVGVQFDLSVPTARPR